MFTNNSKVQHWDVENFKRREVECMYVRMSIWLPGVQPYMSRFSAPVLTRYIKSLLGSYIDQYSITRISVSTEKFLEKLLSSKFVLISF
jgi:hypothetical protein